MTQVDNPEDAKFRLEKDPNYPVGYWIWEKDRGNWYLSGCALTYWGARFKIYLASRKIARPPAEFG